MKTFTVVLFCSIVLMAKADDQIQIVRHGTNVTEQPSAALATNVINYLQWCSINSTAYAVKPGTWQDLERSDSFVLLTFIPSRKLNVSIWADDEDISFEQWQLKIRSGATRADRLIDKILVPLPESNLPLHVFAKSGTNVLSFTKMQPFILKLISFEPALHLSSVAPYANLAGIERPIWLPTNGVWIPPTKQ